MLAFVLAAGFGTRFRPETHTIPKPLLPFLGRPILFHLFDELIRQGVDRFVMNAHHLADTLIERVGTAYCGFPITYSVEPQILGTAGALRLAAEKGLLTEAAFLVVNADVFTTLPLSRLRVGVTDETLSSLAVIPNNSETDTPLWSDAEGRLVGVGGRPVPECSGPWLFTGAQFVSRTLLGRIPPGLAELSKDLLIPSLENGERAFRVVPYRVPEEGVWFDLGTRERLQAAEKELQMNSPKEKGPDSPGPPAVDVSVNQ